MFSSNIGFGPNRFVVALACASLLAVCGNGAHAGNAEAREIPATLSPRAEEVSPHDTWRLAEMVAAERPGSELFIGSGGSMSPLYPDRTVVVTEPMEMSDLRAGMTVVFYGDSGRLVAHTLVTKTARGWIARGMANGVADETLVRFRNYVGTVVRAFAPNPNVPALARFSLPASDMQRLASVARQR